MSNKKAFWEVNWYFFSTLAGFCFVVLIILPTLFGETIPVWIVLIDGAFCIAALVSWVVVKVVGNNESQEGQG